nr:hypothetical protein [uncultured Amphritea sp.]
MKSTDYKPKGIRPEMVMKGVRELEHRKRSYENNNQQPRMKSVADDTFVLNISSEQDVAEQEEVKDKVDVVVNDFVLTGSNRIADVAAARGQKDMFEMTPASSNQGSSDSQIITRLTKDIHSDIFMDGIELAGYHIEKGQRMFSSYARAMIDNLGDGIKPYLKPLYMGLKHYPLASGLDGFDDEATVAAFNLDRLTSNDGIDQSVDRPKLSEASATQKVWMPAKGDLTEAGRRVLAVYVSPTQVMNWQILQWKMIDKLERLISEAERDGQGVEEILSMMPDLYLAAQMNQTAVVA